MFSSRSRAAGLVVALLGMAALSPIVSSSRAASPLTADEKQLEAWWADLEKDDMTASRALLHLYDRPKDAVAYLKKKMKPLTISSGQVEGAAPQVGQRQ